MLLLELHKKFGNKWKLIETHFKNKRNPCQLHSRYQQISQSRKNGQKVKETLNTTPQIWDGNLLDQFEFFPTSSQNDILLEDLDQSLQNRIFFHNSSSTLSPLIDMDDQPKDPMEEFFKPFNCDFTGSQKDFFGDL